MAQINSDAEALDSTNPAMDGTRIREWEQKIAKALAPAAATEIIYRR